jgi:hypothetical protein
MDDKDAAEMVRNSKVAAEKWRDYRWQRDLNDNTHDRLLFLSGYTAAFSQSRDAWTPVEKGLPSQSGEYLVTRQMNVPVIDVVAFYHDDKRRGFWGGCIPDVVAWMPLPGPYEQEK